MLDLARHEALLGGIPLDLTPTEYLLLVALGARVGETVPHGALLAQIWGVADAKQRNLLKIYINRLRDKLGDDADYPRHIRAYRGVGYRLLDARVLDT